MSFTLFEEPKMERVARHLVSTLEELCRQKWSKYLTLVGSKEVGTPMHLDLHENMKEIVEISRFNRKKDHFSWDLSSFVFDSELAKTDAINEYEYYANIFILANDISENVEKKNYGDVEKLIKDMKELTYILDHGRSIQNKIGYTTGGNILVDLINGIAGIIHALIMLLVGAVYAVPYYKDQSQYCGGPQFFIDTLSYLAESVLKIVGSICPPLGMLYSKYSTDSFNTLTKGKVERALDSLESLAQEETRKIKLQDDLKAEYKSDQIIGY